MTLSILIAEDSATNRLLFSMTLARLGHKADIAVNGREALVFFRARPYDLVFLDLNMPLSDGIETAREIRKINTRHTPVYAISGFPAPEQELKFAGAGIARCLLKPLDRLKLDEVIAECGLQEKASAAPGEATSTSSSVLMRTYVSELRSRAQACLRDHADKDNDAFMRECHTIRSLAQMLGLDELERMAWAIEMRLGPGQEPPSPAAISGFAAACLKQADDSERRFMHRSASA